MTYGEALRLTRQLSMDPSSMISAAVNEWDAPRSREWLILADLYDLTHQIATSKRITPYPRPWPDENTTRVGRTTLPPGRVRELLARRGPKKEA